MVGRRSANSIARLSTKNPGLLLNGMLPSDSLFRRGAGSTFVKKSKAHCFFDPFVAAAATVYLICFVEGMDIITPMCIKGVTENCRQENIKYLNWPGFFFTQWLRLSHSTLALSNFAILTCSGRGDHSITNNEFSNTQSDIRFNIIFLFGFFMNTTILIRLCTENVSNVFGMLQPHFVRVARIRRSRWGNQ
jgi:hypothetical protein